MHWERMGKNSRPKIREVSLTKFLASWDFFHRRFSYQDDLFIFALEIWNTEALRHSLRHG